MNSRRSERRASCVFAEPAAEIDLAAQHQGAGLADFLDAGESPQFGLESLPLNRRLEGPVGIVGDRLGNLDLAQHVAGDAGANRPEVLVVVLAVLAGATRPGSQLEVEGLDRFARRAREFRHRGDVTRPVGDHPVDAGGQGLEGVAPEAIRRREKLAAVRDVVDVDLGLGQRRLAGVDAADQTAGGRIAEVGHVQARPDGRGGEQGDRGDRRQDSRREQARERFGRPGAAGMVPAIHLSERL